MTLDITFPWPPSVNHYWAARGNGRYLSPQAKAWHKEAWALLKAQRVRFTGEVAVYLMAYPPDRRRRDLDNILKAVLDALVKAQVLEDDHQVAELHLVRRPPLGGGGKVRVVVEEI
ncbi:RusA family crossover junction endodeoxyribonuclease [Thermus sp. PS18]|uniref:RusA family crossover junction endodeoxyribonuclease n=1 Tax=Thermus sp. PS18 TaxID=2849039 RepID=UPI002264B2D2|nr:RusA family crossover junction endodeoxyribonuclease [Thermus sp. PS18]UZX16542.1 RusA family crossover junction endodeoxyribonuclease [Thermus sp. PS18]